MEGVGAIYEYYRDGWLTSDADVALLYDEDYRPLTWPEAVQSRTIFVAGARDDLLRAAYEAMKRSDVLTPQEFSAGAQLVSLDDIPNRATSSFHGDIAVMLELLERAGSAHVLARELEASAFEASVARVLVPGLEPYHFQWVAAGERARSFNAERFVS